MWLSTEYVGIATHHGSAGGRHGQCQCARWSGAVVVSAAAGGEFQRESSRQKAIGKAT